MTKKQDDALTALVQARVDARKEQLRKDQAIVILAEKGSVSQEELDRRLDEIWVEPTAQELRNIAAAKTGASVVYLREQLDRAREAAVGQRAKLKNEEDLLRSVQEAIKEADAGVTRAEKDLAEAEDLYAAAVAAGGDAALVPPDDGVQAQAGLAGADATAGGAGTKGATT